MARIEVIGLKTDLATAVGALQALGTVQIEAIADCPEAGVPPLVLPAPDTEREQDLASLLVRLDRLRDAMDRHGSGPVVAGSTSLDEARAGCVAVAPAAEVLLTHCQELTEEASRLDRVRPALAALALAAPALPPEREACYYSVDRGQEGAIDALAASLASTGGGVDAVWAPDGNGAVAVMLVYPRTLAAEVAQAARLAGIVPLSLPDDIAAAAPGAVLQALDRLAEAIGREREEAEQHLRELSARHAADVVAWQAAVASELECLQVRRRFGETAATFVLVGWVPEAAVLGLTATLESALGGVVSVRKLALSAAESRRAPVALHNPRAARPFESLVRLISLPGYGATDPTVLMAILLPVFSGMMLGDVGYGIVLLGLSLWLRGRVAGASTRDLLSVLAIGAAWAIGFGLLYGEFFGTVGARLGLRPIWGERTDPEHMTTLLAVSVAIGVLHVSLGLALGIHEAVRQRSRAHLFERGGMLVGLLALLALMGVAAGVLPRPVLPVAVGGIVLGVGLLAASIGWLGLLLGPIEFIGLIGNVLSYLRIAAIGLASALLATVANDMAGLLGNLFAGIVIALLIHALNLVLGVFSPTIHSLRLHYVEFFRKFYEGGGTPYRPFRVMRPSPSAAGPTGGRHGR